MSYSQAMQSSSSTIALQPLKSQWSLDADGYCIHSKNHHRLYPPPHVKLSHLKSIIKWPKKSSPPTPLPYHIGDPIFFEDPFIPYAFVDFVDSDDYNSAWRKERVAEFEATVLAKTSIPTVKWQDTTQSLSGEPELTEGTWLQLMCCAPSRSRCPKFRSNGVHNGIPEYSGEDGEDRVD